MMPKVLTTLLLEPEKSGQTGNIMIGLESKVK